MFIKRDNERYTSHARVRMPGILEGDALLRDFSISGCCIESTIRIDVTLHKTYTLEIIPEKASDVKKFAISAEVRWIRTVDYTFYVGFFIAVSPKGKLFQHFVDYIDYIRAHPHPSDNSTDTPGSRNITLT